MEKHLKALLEAFKKAPKKPRKKAAKKRKSHKTGWGGARAKKANR
jgi:hypothetical protein